MNENRKTDFTDSIVFDELSNRVIGAALQVHKHLGPGFMEAIYEQALKIELAKRGIRFESQKQIQVDYESVVTSTRVGLLMNFNNPVLIIKRVE